LKVYWDKRSWFYDHGRCQGVIIY